MIVYRIRRTVASATTFALVFFLTGCVLADPEPGESNDWNPLADDGGAPSALDCKSPTACDVSYEVGGVCVVETLPGCEPCPTGAGTLRPGLGCCAGCWAGETCYEAPNEYACGSGGGLCESCGLGEVCFLGTCMREPAIEPTDGKSCVEQSDCYFDACEESACVDGVCQNVPYPDGEFCFGVFLGTTQHFAGKCTNGRCIECQTVVPPPYAATSHVSPL